MNYFFFFFKLTSWDMGCLFVCTLKCVKPVKTPFRRRLSSTRTLLFTSIATTHQGVAHICIILINVNTGLPSLGFTSLVDAVGSRKKATLGLVAGQKFMAHNGSQCAATAPTSPGEFQAFWSPIVSISMPEILPFSRTMSLVHLV